MAGTHQGRQTGFTLVELAIVMVIIGLLIGGVLKGQELIENAKVKSATQDLNGISAAYSAYLDRYRRTPGDDGPLATLQGRGSNWANIPTAGNQNGIIDVSPAQVFNGTGESAAFFSQLRAAGFLAGNPADAAAVALPRNPWGGLISILNNIGAGGVLNSQPGNLVCISEVPGKAAIALDSQQDDGLSSNGSIRATLGVAGANTAPGAVASSYSEDNVYTVCRTL